MIGSQRTTQSCVVVVGVRTHGPPRALGVRPVNRERVARLLHVTSEVKKTKCTIILL